MCHAAMPMPAVRPTCRMLRFEPKARKGAKPRCGGTARRSVLRWPGNRRGRPFAVFRNNGHRGQRPFVLFLQKCASSNVKELPAAVLKLRTVGAEIMIGAVAVDRKRAPAVIEADHAFGVEVIGETGVNPGQIAPFQMA